MPPFEFLGPYRIGEKLGQGGMGSVYRAVHEKTGEPVAVKLIAAQVADEPRFRRRFDAEVKTLLKLRHDGIVRLIGFGEERGQLFYSMELVEGESLQARIKRVKKLDWMQAIDIAIEVCAALKHAHDMGVIHRDLKPANLLLTSDNHVKLVDFGIAKIFGDGQNTLIGSVLGTADYMAPEQIDSSGITVRTDLYAVGSLMYAMLTGRPPFRGKSTTQVIASLKRDRPVPLDIINPELPEPLVELVHQLLEKDPADRPPTALSVMNRLKAMRAGLLRSQTVVSEGSSTEVASQPTIDTADKRSDSDSESEVNTNVSNDPTLVRGLDESFLLQSAARANPVASDPTTPTVVSDTRESRLGAAGDRRSQTTAQKTHFQVVAEKPDGAISRHSAKHAKPTWLQWVGVAAMAAILLAGAVLLLLAMRPPSADELYLAATQANDTGSRKAFLRRFPEDERATEVKDLLMSDQLRGAINRISAQSKLGVASLSAAEEAFLQAMEGREDDPQAAAQRLGQWLRAFDNPANREDPKIATLLELADHEHQRLLEERGDQREDPKLVQLMREIDAAEQLEDPGLRREKLEAIIELFDSNGWASPALERARRLLEEIPNDSQ